MRKAFTLIELLVVITIIAILAAILFPVFAQAKTAAKKTATLSNIKQVGTAIQIYMADYDDILPRQDNCDSQLLNPALSNIPFPANGIGQGCTTSHPTAGFLYRGNHFRWQKWVLPYTKNREIFGAPVRPRDSAAFAQGAIVDQFAINTGLTGALNTYVASVTGQVPGNGAFRNSWLGGSGTSVPSPSEALLLMETGLLGAAHMPHVTQDPFVQTQTTYPVAFREFWRYRLMEGTAADCVAGTRGTVADNRKTTNGQVIIGTMDSSARSIPAAAFLARTPTIAETGATITFGSSALCTFTNIGGNLGVSTAGMNTSINYPMWGFGN